MDIQGLDQLVSQFIGESIAPSARRVYMTAERRYLAFCQATNTPPIPLTEQHLCRYVAHLAEGKLKHTTIKGYLSALRRMQIVGGAGDPFTASWPLLEYTLRGIKLKQARAPGTRSRPRLPITPNILRMLRQVWELDNMAQDNIMLWAACCLCFFGFLRSGEITVPSRSAYDQEAHLSEGDVRLDAASPPQYVMVRIKASKTDPFTKGVSIFLGRTGNDLCPVAAIAAYLVSRGREPGPFFRLASGTPLSREVFVKKVREALTKKGVEASNYAGHSFRIGAATTAALVGLEDSLIKTLGRWESSAYLLYVRVPRSTFTAVSQRLAGTCASNP